MNSRTSRPRSPTRAITFTSAVVERAIMPSSEDLPTPEPAKMPRRCPRPHGTSASSARTPRSTRSSMRGRESASGGAAAVERGRPASARGIASSGLPSPSITRPSRSSPTRMRKDEPVARAVVPGPIPSISPSGISSVRCPRKPTTSAGTGSCPRSPLTRQTSPTSACSPVASITRPIRSDTRPERRARSLPRSSAEARAR